MQVFNVLIRFEFEQDVFPSDDKFLGFETCAIERNWMELKNVTFKTEDVVYKPYNLVEFKMKQPLDEFTMNLFDPENIFKKLHMDHMFTLNYAHPIPDPSSAMLLKVEYKIKAGVLSLT